MTTKRWAYQDEADEFDRTEHDLRGRKRADVRIGKEPKSSLAIRFDATDLERLRQRAEAEDMGITQLVRSWVLERLDEPEPNRLSTAALVEMLETARKMAKAMGRASERARR